METITGTTKDFEKILGVEATVAAGFVRFLASRGLAKEVGRKKNSNGRGKTAAIWEIPKTFTVTIDDKKDEAA